MTGLQRRVLPLVEVRADFELSRSELRDADRGADDADLGPLDKAAHQIAVAENIAVFHGWDGAIAGDRRGLAARADAARRRARAAIPRQVAGAVERLLCSGISGPYGLALGREQYRRVVETAEHGGYPLLDHLRKILDGPDRLGAGRRRARSCSACAAATSCSSPARTCRSATTRHDGDAVRLYLEESFSFHVATPEAAVALTD